MSDWRLVGCIVFLLIGCESGGGSGSGSDGGGGGPDATTGGGDTGTGNGGTCSAPAGATVMADFAAYGEDSVVREIAVTASKTWFRADRAVYDVRSGGAATQVHACPPDLLEGPCALSKLEGDRLLIRTGSEALDETLSSVTYPAWKHPTGGVGSPTKVVIAPNGDIIGKFDELNADFSPASTGWTRLAPGAAEAEIIMAGVLAGGGREVVFGAGAAWTNATQTDAFNLPDPDAIWRIGIDDEPTGAVNIDRPGEILLATSSFLYFARDRSNVLGEQGVWRTPVSGGSAELVVPFVPLYGDIVEGGGTVAILGTDSIWAISDSSGATARKVLSLPVRSTLDTSCTSHGLAVSAGTIYGSMFDQARDMSLLFSVAVP